MTTHTPQLIMALCLGLLLAPEAWGQKRVGPAQISYVYPAGGRQGTTFDVEIGGAGLWAVTKVHITGSGVQASIPDPKIDPNAAWDYHGLAKEITRLRGLLNPKGGATDPREIADITLRGAIFSGRRRVIGGRPPGMGAMAVRITLAPDAEIGQREVRVETAGGLSNSYPFLVGSLPEFHKVQVCTNPETGKNPVPDIPLPPAVTAPPGSPMLLIDENMPRRRPPPTFTLPATVNGQIFSGQEDRYRFQARQGQQLVISAVARELKPYLADGSPGWFVAVLTLYDAKGREVACSQSYQCHADPVIFHKVATDGEYVLEVKDAVYRGRYDFVYRISVGEQPFITSMFPLGGPAGAQTAVKLEGWNLPTPTVTAGANSKAAGTVYLSVRNKDGISNSRPFIVDTLPECLEKEPNSTTETAQPVALPIIVNGRIDQPGDWDVFRFDGKAGQEIVAEVHARRLDSPMDSVLKLTDSNGKQLAYNDDYEETIGGAPEGWTDKGLGRDPHHADSHIRVTLPADGTYYLRLGDIQGKGGPEYAYRLHIRPSRPDFMVLVNKSSISMRPGATAPLAANILRREGFTGAVDVTLRDAPAGVKLTNPYVSPKSPNQMQFVLAAPAAPIERPFRLVVEGRAAIEGREVVHTAVPVEPTEQAFGGYYHLVPAKEIVMLVAEPPKPVPPKPPPTKPSTATSTVPAATLPAVVGKIVTKTPIRVPIEGAAQVKVLLSAETPSAKTVRLNDPPAGITVKEVSESLDGMEIVFQIQSDPAAGSRPGQKGNLSVDVMSPGKLPQRPRRPVCTLPEIPYEIMPTQGK